ncbi:hypothetical protein [Shewanella salipaludis]|uniref:Uncharacterized protein n=1 Tax=Shewanella salipaludis TaxID=2723052 RepID=A0A972FUQ7_9GAMM|nr:hypothetical protein [Shewanella salipaludis]NMH66468.1 hypothetical protein [Shewanella salipaludis]
MERLLIHIPIIHSQADMGSLQETTEERAAVTGLWQLIENTLCSFELPFERVRLYQDGLPVSDMEEQIVRDVAAQGSLNHRLLLRLMEQGASLMGTESPALLLEEYQFCKQQGQRPQAAEANIARHAQSLLDRRDGFIAERINNTLGAGEIGILFLGALHRPEKWLAEDIRVLHPFQFSDPAGA